MTDRTTDEYHLQSIRSAFVREALGGCKASESSLFGVAVAGLVANGHTAEQIIEMAKPKLEGIIG